MVSRAKGENKAGGGGDEGDQVVDDPKKAGISKDDKAKEEEKKKEEEKAMNELTEQYGADALRDAFWQFVKVCLNGMRLRSAKAPALICSHSSPTAR